VLQVSLLILITHIGDVQPLLHFAEIAIHSMADCISLLSLVFLGRVEHYNDVLALISSLQF
jgi:hypothetical protein